MRTLQKLLTLVLVALVALPAVAQEERRLYSIILDLSPEMVDRTVTVSDFILSTRDDGLLEVGPALRNTDLPYVLARFSGKSLVRAFRSASISTNVDEMKRRNCLCCCAYVFALLLFIGYASECNDYLENYFQPRPAADN